MKIAAAQIKPITGDINANIMLHKRFIRTAVSSNVDAIFFPELSITGYEPSLADKLAITHDDLRFDEFVAISQQDNITIGIGMPLRTNRGIQIAMFIFQPGKEVQIYAKQQLHEDELPYFINGEGQLILTIADKKLAPAICYESLRNDHIEHAIQLGAQVYLASVAKSKTGIQKAEIHFPLVAQKFAIPVLMVNLIGFCDNFLGEGKTAFWSPDGILLAQLNDSEEALLVVDTKSKKTNTIVMH